MRTLIPSLLWFSALAPACFAKARQSVSIPAKSRGTSPAKSTAPQTEPVKTLSPKFQNKAAQSMKTTRAARRQTI